MILVFQTGDIFMFKKDYGTYTGGQIIILGEQEESIFNILGDIRKDDELKPASVTGSAEWLNDLYHEGIIEFLGEKK